MLGALDVDVKADVHFGECVGEGFLSIYTYTCTYTYIYILILIHIHIIHIYIHRTHVYIYVIHAVHLTYINHYTNT